MGRFFVGSCIDCREPPASRCDGEFFLPVLLVVWLWFCLSPVAINMRYVMSCRSLCTTGSHTTEPRRAQQRTFTLLAENQRLLINSLAIISDRLLWVLNIKFQLADARMRLHHSSHKLTAKTELRAPGHIKPCMVQSIFVCVSALADVDDNVDVHARCMCV